MVLGFHLGCFCVFLSGVSFPFFLLKSFCTSIFFFILSSIFIIAFSISSLLFTRFSSRPLAWLVKLMLKSVHYTPFLQWSVRLKFV